MHANNLRVWAYFDSLRVRRTSEMAGAIKESFMLVSRNQIAHGIYILVDSSGKMAGIEPFDLFPGFAPKGSMIVKLKSYTSFKKKRRSEIHMSHFSFSICT
jgi:hypothetical protein